MLVRRAIPFIALIVGLLISSQLLQADDSSAKRAEEGPTADHFHLKVESLVDNVADLDVRRFTTLAVAGSTLKFHIGKAGVGSKGRRTDADKADVCRLETIVLLRLQGGKIRRLIKFHRTKGSSVETAFDALGRESLAGVVEIKAKSGRYPMNKPLIVGTVDGKDMVVLVE